MDIEELLNDKEHVITDPYFKVLLERKFFEQKFFGPEPVKFDKENADIVEEYAIGKKKRS